MELNRRWVLKTYDEGWFYDPVHNAYFGSRFSNYGYWRSGTRTQREASENLVAELLSAAGARQGRILDVACGKGESTRYLRRFFPPEDIVAINISDRQLRTCKQHVPECEFVLMDAAQLGFDDESFDTVLCVEAAFHFKTRRAFLAEACRVLRPGGHLVLSDILFSRIFTGLAPMLPHENYVRGVEEYRRLCRSAGLTDVEIRDVTADSWKPYRTSALTHMSKRYWRRRNVPRLVGFWIVLAMLTLAQQQYLLVSARKAA